MFEGVVIQVLAGYLGRYVKGLQKDQLKIGIWNEEILLENVELILEAFDYLRLPFGLKQGKIGKLSIRIPWKKLGWDPIIIVLENVFISACQREETEWSSEFVENRELAAKMAKLNAAELAKISKRVSDDQAGQSFISYISAKILDNIQIYIQDFHVVYVDILRDVENAIFGLRFSSLKIRTDSQKLDSTGISAGKIKGGQVNKVVEISGLGIYCNSIHDKICPTNIVGNEDFQSYLRDHVCLGGYDYIVTPFDFSVSLSVNKSAKVDGCPQYMVTAQLTSMVFSVDEVQLKQILSLLDHFSVCALREKYGRYRPTPFAKCSGWQRRWWHYAHESVVADIRWRLRKFSWNYIGKRLNLLRKYVGLYKQKLESIQRHQVVEEYILLELEELDKQCDIEDILNFRSIAELQLQVSTMSMKPAESESYQTCYVKENVDDNEHISSNARSWLSWLSLGMLGAGGTATSSSFSGIVSDDIIKDIYEATEFHPSPFELAKVEMQNFILFSLKIKIHETVLMIRTKRYSYEFARVLLNDSNVHLEVSKDSAAAGASISFVKVINPCEEKVMLFSKEVVVNENVGTVGHPSIKVQIELPQQNQNAKISVICQAFEVVWGRDFFQNLIGFVNTLLLFEFQSKRVLSSLNRFEDVGARLSSKALYLLSTTKRLLWDTTFNQVSVIFPHREDSALVLKVETFFCRSRPETESTNMAEDAAVNGLLSNFHLSGNQKTSRIFQLHDLYDHFEIGVTNLEACMSAPSLAQVRTIIEKYNAFATLSICVFFDEPLLRQMEARCVVSSVSISLSLSIVTALWELLFALSVKHEGDSIEPFRNNVATLQCLMFLSLQHFNVTFNLENDEEKSTFVSFALEDLDCRCLIQEFLDLSLCLKTLTVESFTSQIDTDNHVLCSCSGKFLSRPQNLVIGNRDINSPFCACENTYSEGCLHLHYRTQQCSSFHIHEYSLIFNDIDLHIHPKIFGLLLQCLKVIQEQSTLSPEFPACGPHEVEKNIKDKAEDTIWSQKFGFSNFYASDLVLQGISLNSFPFVTVQNADVLSSTGSSCSVDVHSLQNLQVKNMSDGCQSSDFRKNIGILKDSNTINANFGALNVSGNASVRHVITLDLHLKKIRVHFHDYTSMLLMISLPVCESSFTSDGVSYRDFLCSAENLTVSSSWFSPSTQVLWGPALPNVSPILNVRARWKGVKEKPPLSEISLGIQHVLCILPQEFLAIMVGYFMLPDWMSTKNVVENEMFGQVEEARADGTVFKFEILKSNLRLPLGCSTDKHLCLGLDLLYGSFIHGYDSVNDMDALPNECWIAAPTAITLKFLNVFVHDVSLFLHITTDVQQLINFDSVLVSREICLIQKLTADLLVIIPCANVGDFSTGNSSCPYFTRITVKTCDLTIEDKGFCNSLEAVINLINHYADVGAESEYYQCDVLQFMQEKQDLKGATATANAGKITKTCIMKMSVDNLSMKLKHIPVLNYAFSEVIAEVKVQFSFDVSFTNKMLGSANIFMHSLLLKSFDNSILLSSAADDGSNCCSLLFHITLTDNGETVFVVHIPHLDVWLYLSDWNKIIDHLYACVNQPSGSLETTATCEVFQAESRACYKSESYPHMADSHSWNYIWLRLGNYFISFHFPFSEGNHSFENISSGGYPESSQVTFCKKESKFLRFDVQNRDSELTVSKTNAKFRFSVEEVRGSLEIAEKFEADSLSFLLISHVVLEAELPELEQPIIHMSSDLCVESFDVRLSHEIFKFWSNVQLLKSGSTPRFPFTIDFKASLNSASVLLNDGKWSCTGPILELIMKHGVVKAKQSSCLAEACVSSEISVNYKNIKKVMWEVFVEPWSFELKFIKAYGDIVSSSDGTADFYLKSTELLNLNATDALVEVISRVIWMIKDANEEVKIGKGQENIGDQGSKVLHMKRHAPYILRNDTSLPLFFWVYHDDANGTDYRSASLLEGSLQPGFSVPIFVKDAAIEKNTLKKTSHSSKYFFLDKKEIGSPHYVISILLEGASSPSKFMSMDLVGINFFEVNFTAYQESNLTEISGGDITEAAITCADASLAHGSHGTVVPVAFDVSMYYFSKLIRLYSKVVLLNATTKSLELRFDIPFGISPKILGPLAAGQEFPLPVHLAESGIIRWRPVGSDYLWSDAYSLSRLLSKEHRTGVSRLYVCYPTNHSSDPFRCCISVEDCNLGSLCGFQEGSSSYRSREETSVYDNRENNHARSNKWFVHRITLVTPVLLKNCLPTSLSLDVDSGGLIRSVFLPETGVLPLFHADSAHELGITFHLQGFKPAASKLPRADAFIEMSKENNSRCSVTETLAFFPDTSSGAVFVSVEKTMDADSGAREICLSVPFLLYNCTGIPLAIVDGDLDGKGNLCIIPSSYNFVDDRVLPDNDGLSLIPLDLQEDPTRMNIETCDHLLSKRQFLSPFFPRSHTTSGSASIPRRIFPLKYVDGVLLSKSNVLGRTYDTASVSEEIHNSSSVKPCIYSPLRHLPSGELFVRLHAYFPHLWAGTNRNSADSWSTAFSLTPASGSTTVSIPQPGTTGAFLASISSRRMSGDLFGRARAIIFQPRYVICNACNKEICHKQKGTNFYFRLGIGQHSHLHWADRMRELLISIRFNEKGWQWSGSFLPDFLGDTLVKMRNYISGETCMVRIEVQNADSTGHDENAIIPTNGTSGTHLILISNDNTGFMPYRIDNYSMEKIRVYQQKCEMFETVVHSYTSCQYAWDEPALPHRLAIEVPGERILGSYNFDDVGEYKAVSLPQTLEKPERNFFVAVHADGATKVLTVVDSLHHNINDILETGFLNVGEQKFPCRETQVEFSERIRVQLSIGVSLVDSTPEELIYARAEDITLIWLQNSDRQRIFFQISSMQIDNQLRSTQYPVMMSFIPESAKNLVDQLTQSNFQFQEEKVPICGSVNESVFLISAAKWRKRESSVVSFEFVNIRVSPLHIEIEEHVLFQLVDFLELISSRHHGEMWQNINYESEDPDYCTSAVNPNNNSQDSKFKKNPNLQKFFPSLIPQLFPHSDNHLSLPSVNPIGAPWQKVFPTVRKQRKLYVEVFVVSPLKVTLSFSSTPLMRVKNSVDPGSLLQFSSMKLQRSLMAFVDVEGVHFYLREVKLTHIMASWDSLEEILIRHYSRQLLHELYKVFGSAGVIGNPMGFARTVGTGIKDFFSVSAKDLVQNPLELITGLAQGSKSLFNNTIYALSSTTTQFSKAAHKGIVAFAIDDQTAANRENRRGAVSPSGGLLNEFFEGLTGFLQSPIRGAEKHGLPGVLSGIAMGTAGLVARPMASILEATEKTAQSIRNRSSPNHSKHCRMRLPRPVARDRPLQPYSWEEAIGTSVLLDCQESRLRNEAFVLCKFLKQSGKFVVITKRLVLAVSSSSLVGLGSPEFVGISYPNWVIEMEMSLENFFHVDRSEEVVNIVGHTEISARQRTTASRIRQGSHAISSPLLHMSVEFPNQEAAEEVLNVLLYTIEQGESQRWGKHTLHRKQIHMKWS